MTEQQASTTAVASVGPAPTSSHAVLGPMTIRDITVLAAAVVIFVASVLPIVFSYGLSGNLWSLAGLYFLGIGVLLPLAVGTLFTVRRLNPARKPRVGSLSVDQFASVVAGFATAYFFLGTVTNFEVAYLVGLVGALVMLAATVLAPWIPLFAADFAGRAEVPAHPAARDAVPVAGRPGKPKPALALTAGRQTDQPGGVVPAAQDSGQGSGWNGTGNPAVHAPGGQIFTPASETPAAGSPAEGDAGAVVVGVVVAGAAAHDAVSSTASGAAGQATRDAHATSAAPAAASGQAAQAVASAKAAPATQATQTVASAKAAPATQAAPVTQATPATASAKAAPATPATPATQAGRTAPVEPTFQASPEEEAAQFARAAQAAREAQSARAAAELAAAAAAQASAARASANASAAAAARAAEPVSVVVPAADSAAKAAAAPATVVNPQVVNAVPVERAEPVVESIGATVDPRVARAAAHEPFWFAVDRPQNVVDERTRQFVFKLAPGHWVLALEDRGSSFLVQGNHGKTGVLLDLVGIERAPKDN